MSKPNDQATRPTEEITGRAWDVATETVPVDGDYASEAEYQQHWYIARDAALCALQRAEEFRPMEEWDQRDETVLLLVDYSKGEHPLDDATVAITIGHNSDHNVDEGEGQGWQFAGWCWAHDHYTQGKGTPIGWMPLPHHLAALADIRQAAR